MIGRNWRSKGDRTTWDAVLHTGGLARKARKIHGARAYVSSGHKRMLDNPKERRILELEKEITELQRSNEIRRHLVFSP